MTPNRIHPYSPLRLLDTPDIASLIPNYRNLATRFLFCALLSLVTATTAFADIVTVTVDRYLQAQTRGLPGEVTYTIGQLDPRVQMGPCSVAEAFLPAGARLWGKSSVGVRCQGPSQWSIYVPIQVRVIGDYFVSARALAAGTQLTAGDIVMQSGDLTILPAGTVTDPEQAIGKNLRFGIGAGQPLRNDQLLAPYVVQQGQTVRLTTTGQGFRVSAEGKALNNASDGQVAQVRTPSGQVVSGIARPGGIVEVTY